MVNVLDFGAVGDGVNDDTAAIQATIDSLGEAGGIVYIPNGDYLTSAALTLGSSVEVLGESLNARIFASTPDAALMVADPDAVNSDIYVRRLNVRNFSDTPLGIDMRFMTRCGVVECEIADFSQRGIAFGGNTDPENASWSNFVIGTAVRNCPTGIHLEGTHSEGGSPANWITIEHCLIIPSDTTESIGIDLVNGDTVRLINNDVSYAPNATAITIRQHFSGQLAFNRFENIGMVEPSHEIEKEFGLSNFQLVGVHGRIHYQPADYVTFSGASTGGTFTLSRGDETTSDIAYTDDAEALAAGMLAALETLPAVGAGNVSVVPWGDATWRIAWLNGRGRLGRPSLTANGGGLTGDDDTGIAAFEGTQADAIAASSDVALVAVDNDSEMSSVGDLGPHLDIGRPVITRQRLLAVNPPDAVALHVQRNDEPYPRLGMAVSGRIEWSDPATGAAIGGFAPRATDPADATFAWDDDMTIALPRRTDPFGNEPVTRSLRGALHRQEAEEGARDQLRFGMQDQDGQTYARQLFPGFTASERMSFTAIGAGGVEGLTMPAPGARVGDAVIVVPPASLPPGLLPAGFVSDTDTVTIRLFNGSGDDLALNPATWSVIVLQP